jgi:hypothetical protein
MPQGGAQQAPAAAPERSAPPAAQQDKGKAQQQGQAPAQRGQKDQTTGQGAQGQGEQGKAQRQPETKGQGEGKGQTQGQTPQRDQSQQGQTQQRNQSAPQQTQGQKDQGQKDQRQPSQAQGQQGQSGASATLTTEQRTRIRETVISSGPKVSSVNFSLSVGTVVPRTVTVVAVPAIIVEVYPQYRGLLYFVVGDQIIIVDQSHKIVAVISV